MKLGFIGAGNMGGAILQGIINNKYILPEQVWVTDVNMNTCLALADKTKVQVANDNVTLVQNCDMILLAVKPVYLADVISKIQPYLVGKSFISIAAGWSFQMLQSALGAKIHTLRVMPNTPALVAQGMTAICQEHTLSEDEFVFAKGLFDAIGKTAILPENVFDGVIAISGSSPAYVFMMIEAMADGGVKEGIPRALAYKMAAQSVLGAAQMVLETDKHPATLKDEVCSPSGTTIEAVATLESKGLRTAILSAMDACAEKSRKMTK